MAWLSEPMDTRSKQTIPVLAVEMQHHEMLLCLTSEIPEHLIDLLWFRKTHRHPFRGIVTHDFVSVAGLD
jgi:hypothetical protein